MKKLVWLLVISGGLAFALLGGEYSTMDLYRQHVRKQRLQFVVDSLRRKVDSLSAYRKLVESDSVTQERIAREEFGMVRGEKEMLYRFGARDSTKGAIPR